jgi:putative RecB family exonuclease
MSHDDGMLTPMASSGRTYDRAPTVVEVPGGALPDSPWSATSVESFTGCPLKYWWMKVARWETPSTVPLVVGRAVHAALEHLLALPPEQRRPEVGEPLLDAAIAEALAEVADQPIDPAAVTEAAQRAFAAYWDTEDPVSIDVARDGIEREVSADIRGLAFRGFVDRIAVTDAGSRVTDYKTGSAKPKYWWHYWRQQLLYAHALEANDEPVAEVELLFLGDPRSVTRPVYPRAVARALDDLERANEERAAMADAARWEARTGPLCNWCDFQEACPARRPKAPPPGSAASDEILAKQGLRRRTPNSRR